MPEPFSRASLSGRYSPVQLLAEKQPRCKAGADHLARAVRGERIVRAVLDEEALHLGALPLASSCGFEAAASIRWLAWTPRALRGRIMGSVLDEEEAGRHKSLSVEPAVAAQPQRCDRAQQASARRST